MAASAAVALTTLLPWARSGQVTRSGWALAGTLSRLRLDGTGALRPLLIAVLATPVLAAGAWVAAFANRPGIVATLAGSSGLVATSAWVALRFSPLDARVGAHLALVCGGVALLGAATLGRQLGARPGRRGQ